MNGPKEGFAAILTAAPEAMQEGKTLIYFRRKKVPDAAMYRAVFVPQWEQPKELQAIPEVFKVAVNDALRVAAGNILRAAIEGSKDKDGKETLSEIEVALLAFPKVVEEMEKSQTSERLDSATIATWYDASKTKEQRDIAYNNKDKSKKLRDVFLSLASNNPGIIPSLAEKMISYIAEEDTSSAVCAAVVARLARIKQTAVSADEL